MITRIEVYLPNETAFFSKDGTRGAEFKNIGLIIGAVPSVGIELADGQTVTFTGLPYKIYESKEKNHE